MKHLAFILIATLFSSLSSASTNLFDIKPPKDLVNIHVTKLGSDKHASEFLIFIKQQVPLHYHKAHTETVMIISGTAEMVLGEQMINVAAGDYIRIPAGTHHGVKVTSSTPLKVLSIQAPEFLGKDRIPVKQ